MLPYLRLFRLSNIFTVVADTTAAFLLVQGGLQPWGGYLGLLFASCLFYCAGMVLNDVFDLEVDRQERPERPLPSGQIGVTTARRLGFGMLIAGLVLASATGWLAGSDPAWKAGLWACALAAAIVGYDAGLKRTFLGPLAMGSCRTFNFLMAMSLASAETWYVFPAESWSLAGGIGVYVAGITWLARTEARDSDPRQLIGGALVMLLGFLILGSLSFVAPHLALKHATASPWFWPGVLALIGATVARRVVLAIYQPSPQRVQMAVKQSLLTLIVIDASLLLFVFPDRLYYSLFTLGLLAPTLWLGRWIRST